MRECISCGKAFHALDRYDPYKCLECEREEYLETFVKCTKCGEMYDPETSESDCLCDDCENGV